MSKYNISKQFLIKEYIQNKISPYKIAKELGCSEHCIRNRLIKYDIPRRTQNESMKDKTKGDKNGGYIDGRSLQVYFCIEPGCNNKISYVNWVYGNRRCNSCSKKAERNGNYIHGKGNAPYPVDFDEILKTKIRQRDNHTCQLCDKKQFELKGRFKKLDVHHIDYNKENLNPNNLITLCKKCNNNVNKNRDYWFAYFKYIMEECYVR